MMKISTKVQHAYNYLLHNRGQFMDSVTTSFFKWLPDRFYLRLRYRFLMGEKLNLSSPIKFTEKLQWLKLFYRKPEYTMMVDKYAVKQYVSKTIGENYVIPTIGVWDTPGQIDWNGLPKQFVLKTTHGGGSCGVIICKDKDSINRKEVVSKLLSGLKTDLYQCFREWPYKDVKKRIIAEKFMEDNGGGDLTDYKFFCFNGTPKFCQVIRNRRTAETIDFYNMDWIHQEFIGLNPKACNGSPKACNGSMAVERPVNFDEMKSICSKLSKDNPFTRVDLYEINNKVYFGEITFYPASGFGKFTPNEYNRILGEMIVLPKEKQENR